MKSLSAWVEVKTCIRSLWLPVCNIEDCFEDVQLECLDNIFVYLEECAHIFVFLPYRELESLAVGPITCLIEVNKSILETNKARSTSPKWVSEQRRKSRSTSRKWLSEQRRKSKLAERI